MARDLKLFLQKNENEVFDQFVADEKIKTKFGRPIIRYVRTEHPLFDTFFMHDENDHPKNLYRPGYTAIVSYVPYYIGDTPEEIRDSFFESIQLIMRLNSVVKKSLTAVGRLSSNTCNLIDWDKTNHRREWLDLLVAYLAGMGEFGPAGSFVLNEETIPEGAPYGQPGWTGRAGTILTDGIYADKAPHLGNKELEAEFSSIQRARCIAGTEGLCCSEEMIKACPGGAISPAGIDRAACQDYCATINARTPNPDVCGQCYRFHA